MSGINMRAMRVSTKLKKKGILRELRRSSLFYLLLLPTFALILTFNYYPALSAIYHAFFKWSVIEKEIFIGLDNFKRMVRDPILGTSIVNLLQLVGVRVVISVVVPFTVAELFFAVKNMRVQYWYRVVILLPMIVPGMVNLLIWQFIFSPHLGMINSFLGALGLERFQNDWLGNPNTALYSLMFRGFPWLVGRGVAGAGVLIFLAGLFAIPQSLMDSAKLDGVTGFRRIFYLDIHFVIGQIKLFIILGFINGMQNFGEILVLTQGGPINRTMTPALHMYYEAFSYDRLGYASSIGFAMFLILLILTYINMRFVKSKTEYEA